MTRSRLRAEAAEAPVLDELAVEPLSLPAAACATALERADALNPTLSDVSARRSTEAAVCFSARERECLSRRCPM